MKHFILLLFISFSFTQETNSRLSLIDFENKATNLSSEEISIIGNRVETLLVQSGKFQVITITERDAILGEQKFQNASGCVDVSCAVEVGRLLGASYMISGSVGQFGTAYVINAKMFNVETGEIEKAAEFYTTNHKIEELLIQGVEDIINQLTGVTTRFESENNTSISYPVVQDTIQYVFTHITITPKRANARIYIDEKLIGTIPPFGIEIKTTVGKHWIQIESNEFETISKEIFIGHKKRSRNIKLKQKSRTHHNSMMMNKNPEEITDHPKLTLGGGVSIGYPSSVNGNFRAHYRFINFELAGGENKKESFKGDQVSIGLGTKKFVVNYIQGKWVGDANLTEISGNQFTQDEYNYTGWSVKSFKKLLFWEMGVVKSDIQVKDMFYLQVGLLFLLTF